MKKIQSQNPFAYGTHEDPLRIAELIEAVQTSSLSNAKKLAYLYMIAEGSFSGETMKLLLKDLEDEEKKLVRQLREKEKKRTTVEAEITKLEENLLKLTPKAMSETQENLQQLVKIAAVEKKEKHQNKS